MTYESNLIEGEGFLVIADRHLGLSGVARVVQSEWRDLGGLLAECLCNYSACQLVFNFEIFYLPSSICQTIHHS